MRNSFRLVHQNQNLDLNDGQSEQVHQYVQIQLENVTGIPITR
jgi:hypothetical protein